jgi:hypothetical protein
VKSNLRALLLTAFGGPENFVLKEAPKPVVQPDRAVKELILRQPQKRIITIDLTNESIRPKPKLTFDRRRFIPDFT